MSGPLRVLLVGEDPLARAGLAGTLSEHATCEGVGQGDQEIAAGRGPGLLPPGGGGGGGGGAGRGGGGRGPASWRRPRRSARDWPSWTPPSPSRFRGRRFGRTGDRWGGGPPGGGGGGSGWG